MAADYKQFSAMSHLKWPTKLQTKICNGLNTFKVVYIVKYKQYSSYVPIKKIKVFLLQTALYITVQLFN